MKFPFVQIALGLLLLSFHTTAQQLITYPAPDSAQKATDFQVTANGRDVFVYGNAVSAMASFSFEGRITIEITSTHDIRWVDIRPRNLKIPVSFTTKKLTFQLENPCQLSIELNGEHTHPLYVFAAPLEKDVPSPTDSTVRYFASGRIYDIGTLTLKDNETLYIEGGAIVRGNLEATDARNIHLKGRGILDGSLLNKGQFIKLLRCQNVNIEGITLLDSPGWTLVLLDCDNVTIHEFKEVCWRNGSDGIDLVGTSHVRIFDCFLRNNDDNIVIKSFNTDVRNKYEAPKPGRDVTDIQVDHCVIWNMPWGNALEIGFELRCQSINKVIFRDCDLIHVDRGAALSIHNSDYATVENILYDNIRVEDAPHKLIDLAIFTSQYSADRPTDEKERAKRYMQGAWDGVLRVPSGEEAKYAPNRGQIRNITFRNIAVTDGQFPFSIIAGWDALHQVENVHFENISIHGKAIQSAEMGHFSIDHASKISWK